MSEKKNAAINKLLGARSIALCGASDKSNWSNAIYHNTHAFGFKGKVFAVNRKGVPAHGVPGYKSCQDIPEPVDLAYIYVPTEAVLDALTDVAAAGIKSVIVLSSGFAEAGAEGVALQDELVRIAEENGICLIGPNSLGVADVARGNAVTAMRPSGKLPSGKLALLSQSGSVCYEILEYALQQGIGLSVIAAVGNEAAVDQPDMIEALVDRDDVQAFAIFVETIRNPERFIAAARKTFAKRKPIVMLKVGKSEISAAIAQAHTGSLVGDDRVLDAVCARYGVVRVDSIEALINCAALMIHAGVIERPGIGAASLSGGTSGLLADAAEKYGVSFPAFAPETVAALREALPPFAGTLNPLDVTGQGFNDLTLWGRCCEIISRDPGIGFTIAAGSLNPLGAVTSHLGDALTNIGSGGIFLSNTSFAIDSEDLARRHIPAAVAGIEGIMSNLAKAIEWSARVKSSEAAAEAMAAPPAQSPTKLPRSEREVLEHLAAHGVPVVPARIVNSGQQAAEAAHAMGDGPFALKILSPDIQHKTDIGGVRLNVAAGEATTRAYEEIMASVSAARPDAAIDGVIVSPMRESGVELVVGTIRDPSWGPVIVVGLGGVWVEVLKDSQLRPLPIDRSEAIEMVNGLKAAALLKGFRGAPPADIEKLADTIVAIGNAALALGPELATLEINPLRVRGGEIEALDGLATYETGKEA
ncbi:hypothetical protein GCM10011349_44600 [Novosphingobium indicum]|uniref:CoA-binding domain-containing protein n=1 Tax=Novosphingobium indicum TaxID=462949 RepID=A0ABQ2K385_9SPHN|nr:acetate--CoA ligase family protein [Novosphingobium indicum]GGN61700.1 hypothetical protein GCM10011349_44600 [Novosphingobium indicum]